MARKLLDHLNTTDACVLAATVSHSSESARTSAAYERKKKGERERERERRQRMSNLGEESLPFPAFRSLPLVSSGLAKIYSLERKESLPLPFANRRTSNKDLLGETGIPVAHGRRWTNSIAADSDSDEMADPPTLLLESGICLDEFFHRWRKATRVWKDTMAMSVVVVTMDEWKYTMFVWKDECGESESIRVVWCDLSVWDIPWQKKERMREMYARAWWRENKCDREDAQSRVG